MLKTCTTCGVYPCKVYGLLMDIEEFISVDDLIYEIPKICNNFVDDNDNIRRF